MRGFLGIEVLVRNNMSVFSGDSMRTYVPEDVPEDDFRDAEGVTLLPDDVLPEEALAEEVLLPLFSL